MTVQRRFAQVDVFTAHPYRGNPLAVVIDAEGLDTDEMQRFANWTNLSETAFLLPPTADGADYRVRIFTPSVELPFAGHPTLGSCHAWLTVAGGAPAGRDVVQECGAGLVTVRREDARLSFAAPPMRRSGPLDDATMNEVVRVLQLGRDDVVDAAWIDNGPGWIGVLLRSADAVLAVRPLDSPLAVGVIGPYGTGDGAGSPAFEVRGFFPEAGRTVEDPVTGSLNASAAQWLIATGRAHPPYTVSQGTVLGRSGTVHVGLDASGQVWIGGESTTCVEGTVQL